MWSWREKISPVVVVVVVGVVVVAVAVVVVVVHSAWPLFLWARRLVMIVCPYVPMPT